MSQLQLLLAIIGSLFALTAFAWVCIQLAKKLPSEAYDERQKQAQGRAFEICYFVQVIFTCLVVYCYDEPHYTQSGISLSWRGIIVLGFLIQALLYHICCLLQDAALPFSKKPWGTILSYTCTCAVSLLQYFVYKDDYFYPPETQEYLWLFLATGVGSFYLILLHLIQFFRNKRAERE